MSYVKVPEDVYYYHAFYLAPDERDPVQTFLHRHGLKYGDWTRGKLGMKLPFKGKPANPEVFDAELKVMVDEMIGEYLDYLAVGLTNEFYVDRE